MNLLLRRKVIQAGRKLTEQEIGSSEQLPWRTTRTPYRILLAELLLVRTRADVVARIFEEIFQEYPTIGLLANASAEELRTLVKPLGLSKRVPYIIKAAQYIRDFHDSVIPQSVDDLLKVPGVGIYTAVAIAAFAYEQQSVPGDVNILRFISRLTGLEMEHKTKGSQEIWELVPFLAQDKTGLLVEKLLDFTRLICGPKSPSCHLCVLSHRCKYYKNNVKK